jgi:hypothetical protein
MADFSVPLGTELAYDGTAQAGVRARRPDTPFRQPYPHHAELGRQGGWE